MTCFSRLFQNIINDRFMLCHIKVKLSVSVSALIVLRRTSCFPKAHCTLLNFLHLSCIYILWTTYYKTSVRHFLYLLCTLLVWNIYVITSVNNYDIIYFVLRGFISVGKRITHPRLNLCLRIGYKVKIYFQSVVSMILNTVYNII